MAGGKEGEGKGERSEIKEGRSKEGRKGEMERGKKDFCTGGVILKFILF